MNITLDESHIYRVDGAIKPGVTQILAFNGLISDFCKQEVAAQRGDAIHQGAALLFQDMLDWETVDPRILPFLLSLDRFIKMTGFVATSVEQMGYFYLGYCGTWDVTGLFPRSNDDWLIDIKSGAPAKWHPLQLSAYKPMANVKHTGCLYLQADGSLAKLVEHKDPNDWRAWYSALKIYQGEQSLQEHRDNLKSWRET